MSTDIGLRNQRAVFRNGQKVVEKMQALPETKHLAVKYQQFLYDLETIFDAANLIVNR